LDIQSEYKYTKITVAPSKSQRKTKIGKGYHAQQRCKKTGQRVEKTPRTRVTQTKREVPPMPRFRRRTDV